MRRAASVCRVRVRQLRFRWRLPKAALRDPRRRGRRMSAELYAFRRNLVVAASAGIARRFAIEHGLSPGTELEDEDETRARVLGAIEDVVGARFEIDDGVRALVRATGGADRLIEQVARALQRLEEDGRGAADLAI